MGQPEITDEEAEEEAETLLVVLLLASAIWLVGGDLFEHSGSDKADRLIHLVCSALSLPECSALSLPEEPDKPKDPGDSPQSAALKKQLIEAMRKHLPPRTE